MIIRYRYIVGSTLIPEKSIKLPLWLRFKIKKDDSSSIEKDTKE